MTAPVEGARGTTAPVEGVRGTTAPVIVHVSDIHLSRSHAWFIDNWRVLLDELHALGPDLVILTGDVSFNGPEAPDDLAFAAREIARLPGEVLVLPGNHDIGEPAVFQRLKQPVNEERLSRWQALFGPDRWCRDVAGWRLLGLDSELLGSGLAAEQEQWAFLEAALGEAAGPVALFLHRPLWLAAPDEPTTSSNIPLEPRLRLLELIEAGDVRLVASGHLHEYRSSRHGRTAMVWAPGTSFVNPGKQRPGRRGIRRSGYLVHDLAGLRPRHHFVQPELFANIDLSNFTSRTGTTTKLPPRPLVRAEDAPAPAPAGLRLAGTSR